MQRVNYLSKSTKKKCITAALFAKKNREEFEVYKTAIIYTRLKKIKSLHKNILKDVKKRFGGGRFALASDSAFLRMLLEKTQEKINRR